MPKAKPRFIPYNIDQNAIVVIHYRDQLQPGTFEHAIQYLIEHNHSPNYSEELAYTILPSPIPAWAAEHIGQCSQEV